MKKTALVAGANGVIGTNLIRYLSGLPEWDIIGLSRKGEAAFRGLSGNGGADRGRESKDRTGGGANRTGESADRIGDAVDRRKEEVRMIKVDLLDAADSRDKLGAGALEGVTHVFYAAFVDKPSWSELVAPNLAMLRHLVEGIEPVAQGLQHISLMQGYKVYGAHYGPFKTPAKESDAGHMPPEFNVDQQQYLEERQQGKRWTWSALRPSVVGGTALGNPMNLALVIAVYAIISKELGLPLRFPGKPGAYDKLMEMTDAGLLAEATVWAATRPESANQAFNINNGDLFRWNDMWPSIAAYFDMDVAPPLHMPLQTIMADKAPVWGAIREKYGLERHSYASLSSWGFGDFVFSWDYDFFADGTKARRAGFHRYQDTKEMFYRLFDELRAQRVIP